MPFATAFVIVVIIHDKECLIVNRSLKRIPPFWSFVLGPWRPLQTHQEWDWPKNFVQAGATVEPAEEEA